MTNILHISNNYHNSSLWKNIRETVNKNDNSKSVFVNFVKKNDFFPNEPQVFDFNVLTKIDRIFYFRKIQKCFAVIDTNIILTDFRIVHAHTLFSDGGVAYKIFCKYGIPYVISVRNTDINAFYRYKPYLKFYAEKILLSASKIVFLSEAYKSCLIEKYVSKSNLEIIYSKSIVIPNGINDFWFQKQNFLRNRDFFPILNIVTCGTVEKNKNQMNVAKACEILIKKGFNIQYFIVGKIIDKKYFKSLEKYSFIEYLGVKQKKELVEIYKKCDIFVLASYYETFGLVYPEAMTQGLPVIYTQGQGFDRQFPDGTVGYPVKADFPEDIAEKIMMIVKNYTQIQRNLVVSSQKFRIKDICNQFLELYK